MVDDVSRLEGNRPPGARRLSSYVYACLQGVITHRTGKRFIRVLLIYGTTHTSREARWLRDDSAEAHWVQQYHIARVKQSIACFLYTEQSMSTGKQVVSEEKLLI